MKDAWATSGISKLEAYGENSASKVYTFAFLYILFWKRRIWVKQLERLRSFNYPSFSYFKYATYPFLVVKMPNDFQTDKLHTYSAIYRKWNRHFKCLTLHLRKADVLLMNVRPNQGPSGFLQISNWMSLQVSSFSEE